MHIILGLLALIGVVFFWMQRARNAAEMTHELGDMAADVMAAARRFGFRRRHDAHPVEGLDDPKIALAGTAAAFLQLSDLPSREDHFALLRALQSHLGVEAKEAEAMLVLGTWLVRECGSPSAGLTRLAKRLYKLNSQGLESLLGTIKTAQGESGKDLSIQQKEALDEIARIFHVR